MTTVAFTVPGKPAPSGSKTPISTPAGPRVKDTNQDRVMPWRAAIAYAAQKAYDGPLLLGPLLLEVHFVFVRPQTHYGTGRNKGSVKLSAPFWPSMRPDRGKLLRGLEDALTGVLWRDDGQVVRGHDTKIYGERAQTEVYVQTLHDPRLPR